MIHTRFKQYLGVKMLTQKEVAKMSELSENQVSRFCKDGSISVINLQKMLQVCGDLSLEYLFFGYGPMIKEQGNVTVNYGPTNNHTQFDNGTMVVRSGNDNVSAQRGRCERMKDGDGSAMSEKERIILMKDEIITRRDETISSLNETIIRLTELIRSR